MDIHARDIPHRSLRVVFASIVALSVAMAAAPPARAAWSTDPSVNTKVPAIYDTGDSWHLNTYVAGACPDSGGGALVVTSGYVSMMSGYWSKVQRIDAWGQPRWGDGTTLGTNGGSGDYLTPPVPDGSGGVFIVEGSYDSFWGVRLHHILADGSNPPAGPNGPGTVISTAYTFQCDPLFTADATGGGLIAWVQQSAPAGGLRLQRIDGAGAVRWVAGGVPLHTTTLSLRDRCMVPDGAGGAMVFSVVAGSGTGWDIRLFSVSGSGTLRTPAGGAVVCAAAGTQGWDSYRPNQRTWVVSDGVGGAIAVWEDFRSDALGDLYAQRVDSLGMPLWAINGVPVCTRAGASRDPFIVSDGVGGAIVAWEDSTHSADLSSDIYVQRIAASGSALWTTDGIPAYDAPGAQGNVRMIARPAGGAILVFEDGRDAATSGVDLHAQAVSADGALLWGAQGTPTCTAARDQYNPRLVPVGDHAAIAAWSDGRESITDIGYVWSVYSQYLPLDEAPLLGVEPPPSLAPLARLRVAPNPAFASARVALMRDVSAHATLELLDVAGRVVRTRDLSALAPGAREVTLDDLGALPPGLYLVRVKQGERVDGARMMLMH